MALDNRIDEDQVRRQLARWLSSRLPDASDLHVTHVAVPTGSGISALTILFDAQWTEGGRQVSRALVARAQPRESAMFESCDLSIDYRLMSVLGTKTSLPVPTLLGLELEDDTVLGTPFLVMDRVQGRVTSDDPPFTTSGWTQEISPDERATMARNGIAALARLHAEDPHELGLDWLGAIPFGAPRLGDKLKAWRGYFDWATGGQPNRVIEEGFRWLEANMPPPDGDVVISWGDARFGNLIFADDFSVAAMIDWEMCGLGPREFDLGAWIFFNRYQSSGIGVPMPAGFPDEAETIALYSRYSGYTPRNIEYFVNFAALKIATTFVRFANRMVAAGKLPPTTTLGVSNPVAHLLAAGIGVAPPEDAVEDFVGTRARPSV